MEDKSLMDEVFEKAGGRAELQHRLKLSKQTMSDWVREDIVSLRHCPMVHALTRIPLARLNPAFAVKVAKSEKTSA